MNIAETHFLDQIPFPCQPNCGACCIAPSISSNIPPITYGDNQLTKQQGKASGVPCIHLDDNFSCTIFDRADRPQVCHDFKACLEFCSHGRQYALDLLTELENLTNK